MRYTDVHHSKKVDMPDHAFHSESTQILGCGIQQSVCLDKLK